MSNDTKQWFIRGLRDGLPIGLGYFAVAFALGIQASGAGMTALQSTLMSLFNLTSAGEAAAIALIGAGTTYVELAFTQLVINIRYLLMSCALSQKIAPDTSFLHRLLIGYGVTDEIFAVSMAVSDRLSPAYSYGAIAVAVPGWTLGTLLGAVLGNVLPARATGALGVALYAMFLAIILPPARKSKVIAGVVAISMLASALLTLAVERLSLTFLTEGFRIVLLTVLISAVAAWLFPVVAPHSEEVPS
ncbi:MAG: AzlC family ABC transporter permease [Clostridia bacterium]|nr:AzlC family ABC transporter permease [Clostridia bacterium]